ncbi:hypothetical protein ABZ791_10900 [Streptomyces huasconensis]|uniref:Uncharacterized protein n=1 Tax=Streptomyces huasconensis TaxID=1854574 RepID=A0ABV3LPR3_9ACTN
MGFQLVQGQIQLNVIWEYGKDVVRVQRSEGDAPFEDVRTFPIPSDYRGKSRFVIAEGMRDHMRNVCRFMWRKEYGQEGVAEFDREWRLLAFPKGIKVREDTTFSGRLLGVVVGHVRRGSAREVEMRVTSRKNPHYKCGEIIRVEVTSPWLKSREV